MSLTSRFTSTLLAAAALTAVASAANAATLAALVDGNTIALIDTDQKAVTGKVALKGGANLVGIDVRPADGKLYGLTDSGWIVTIDPKTGEWAQKSQITEKLPAGETVAVDFNPAADRMRVIASNGMSLRINVDDGKTTVDGSLKYAETDAAKGTTPKSVASSYTNSVAGTKETALFNIDAATSALVKQAPPNDGILSTIGKIGMTVEGPVGFDIWADGKGANVGWLYGGGMLHTVDLATGTAKQVGKISALSGKVVDVAVLPAG